MACGQAANQGKKLHVDHIKPRHLFPDLELVKSNLQVLCEDCNLGKGAWDQTSWKQRSTLEEMSNPTPKATG